MGKYFYYFKETLRNRQKRTGEGYTIYSRTHGTFTPSIFNSVYYSDKSQEMTVAPATESFSLSYAQKNASLIISGSNLLATSFESDDDSYDEFVKSEFVETTGKFKLVRLSGIGSVPSDTWFFPCNFEYKGQLYSGIVPASKIYFETESRTDEYQRRLSFIKGNVKNTFAQELEVVNIVDGRNILIGDIDDIITFTDKRLPKIIYDRLLVNFDEIFPYHYVLYGILGDVIYRKDDVPTVSHLKLRSTTSNAILNITDSRGNDYEVSWQPSTPEGTKFLGLSFIKNAKRPSIPIGYDQDITIDGNLELYEVFGRDYTPTKTFEMNIYKNSAESNRVDKTNQLVFVDTLNGVLRESSSIAEPVFNISASDVPQFNYVYIPAFNRYYFVVELTSMNYNLWRLSLKCDVLMTYKDGIKALNAFVERNESQFDENIVDKLRPIEEGYDVQSTEIPNNLFGNLSIADKYIVVTGAGITIEEEE